MYAQFFSNKALNFNKRQQQYQTCIFVGNWAMLIALGITLGCLYLSFGIEHRLSIASQIAAHISTIVFAGIFKLGYVIRCVGVHGLGYKVF